MALLFTLLVLSQAALPESVLIVGPGVGMSPTLATNLELTEEQLGKIQELQSSSNIFQQRQTQRQLELQVAIATETAKESPDPFIIGTHYVELETIQRNLAKEKTNVMNRIQEHLSDPQKAKLAQLSEVLSAYPMACEAVNANLITFPSMSVRDPFPNNSIPPSRFTTPPPTKGSTGFARILITPCSSSGTVYSGSMTPHIPNPGVNP